MNVKTCSATILLTITCSASFADDPAKNAQPRAKVSFVVSNSTSSSSVPHVQGTGKIPLRLQVSDDRSNKPQRRLQVFIAVLERTDLGRIKTGALVKTFVDPTIMRSTTPTNMQAFDLFVEVPKGDYIVYVYLCDPDRPATALKAVPRQIDLKLLPGQPVRGSAITARVD